MLTRIFINNYKCFQEFTLTLNPITLLLGPNGSGKSSIFQVLRKLHDFVSLQLQTRDLFFAFESTRWSSQQNQSFAVDLAYQGHQYQYQLEIYFDENDVPSVGLESLLVDEKQIVRFENEKVNLIGQAPYPLEANRSVISSIPGSSAPSQLKTFRQLLERILIVQVTPPVMEGVSSEEATKLLPDSRNWLSWYRHISHDQAFVNELKEYLEQIFPGFSHLHFVDAGLDSFGRPSQELLIHFATDQDARKVGYTFAGLSDGERVLIALYAIMVYAKREGYILCLDEPDNFMGLAEIQPWLVELYMSRGEGLAQALLVSHHPEIINYLGRVASIWLERSENGSVVAQPVVDEADTRLPIAELVARGWIGA